MASGAATTVTLIYPVAGLSAGTGYILPIYNTGTSNVTLAVASAGPLTGSSIVAPNTVAYIMQMGNHYYNISASAAISLPYGTPTYTAGTNVTSVGCASGYTCTNQRGELTIVGGTATTGTIATLNFSAALLAAPGLCRVTQVGGATFFGIGEGTPTTTAFTITAGVTVTGSTVTVDYNCLP